MNKYLFTILILLAAAPAQAAQPLHLDPAKTAEPISKYIYGQFIEHLGNSIYNGLWAEMIQDRKFYFAITDDYAPFATATDPNWSAGPYPYLKASPWKVIGPPGAVTMRKEKPFTGQQSPAIALRSEEDRGLSQPGLALVAGKHYTGRVILAAEGEAGPVEIRLVAADNKPLTQPIAHVTRDFHAYPIDFTAPSASDDARFEIIARGNGTLLVGAASLMPDDNIRGWRRDVVARLKELDSPVYRWPGGNFVSGYDWKDGIGDRDKRPPRKNPAWKSIEANDVGIHEFMDLMQEIHSEPYVALNTGLGSVDQAQQEVEYCNGSPQTPMGKLRAQNGHPEPYNVKFFAVGNEMYGRWQLGHIPLSEYVKKHNQIADALRQVDPHAQLVAVGRLGDWDDAMLRQCADHMSFLSEHVYTKERTDVLGHTALLPDGIRKIADAHRKYRTSIDTLKGKDIRIAMDEWNYWYGDYLYGELGCRYHFKDALGVARGLHEFFRNSDLFFMANYAQTVNVLGCIKTNRTAACLDATGVALALYRNHFGTIPIDCPRAVGNLDVSAAWTEDRSALTIAVVNPTELPEELAPDTAAIKLTGKATRWSITAADPQDYNEPGREPRVRITEQATGASPLEIPAYSIVIYRIDK